MSGKRGKQYESVSIGPAGDLEIEADDLSDMQRFQKLMLQSDSINLSLGKHLVDTLLFLKVINASEAEIFWTEGQ